MDKPGKARVYSLRMEHGASEALKRISKNLPNLGDPKARAFVTVDKKDQKPAAEKKEKKALIYFISCIVDLVLVSFTRNL